MTSSSSACISRASIFFNKKVQYGQEPGNIQRQSTHRPNQLKLNSSRSQNLGFTNFCPNKNIIKPENNLRNKLQGSQLFQSGKAGRKIERCRQLLISIQKNERVTIGENKKKPFFSNQQDTLIRITGFLTALQVSTKQLPKRFLTLVEILALPQFLLTKTEAIQISFRMQNRLVHRELWPRKPNKLDTDPSNT